MVVSSFMSGDVLRESMTAAGPAASRPQTRISYADFLENAGDNEHVEWVDGMVVAMSPVTDWHSDINGFLYSPLRSYAESCKAGRVFCEPFQMKAGPDLPGRAPDILFVANRNLGRVQRLFLDRPADLVVEIISSGSRALDRVEKFFEYERGGVPEFWLIDPQRRQAEFYRRSDDGIYRPVVVGADGMFRSEVLPGLWLKVDWLWQEPLPPLLDVLAQWGLIRPQT